MTAARTALFLNPGSSLRRIVIVGVLAGMVLGARAVQAQDAAEAAKASPPPPPDTAAAKFAVTCAGCHTLAGAQLTGPPLNKAATWPNDTLGVAIRKMEPRTGPLDDATVAGLIEFLKSADSQQRLAREQERMAAQFAAKMDPANPVLGQALFTGARSFANDGLACAACHSVNGTGGKLGPDLTGVFAKTGGTLPMVSAIEGAKFKIMEPHYKAHPVTKQEAIHLAGFFASLTTAAAAPSSLLPRFEATGTALAVLLLVGMFALLHHQRAIRRRGITLRRRRQ